MKRISTILQFALLLLAGIMGANSDAQCSQPTATWVIKNGKVTGGRYTVEVWARATSDPVLIGARTGVSIGFNSAALQWSYDSPVYSSRLSANYIFHTGYLNNYGQQIWFTLATGKTELYASTSSPDGENLFTITLDIVDGSKTPGLYWINTNWGSKDSGFVGAINTFTIGNNNPLPVGLSSFTIKTAKTNTVELDWTTISEKNNYGFNVQRNGANIAFLQGHGTTIEQHTYSYTDNPGQGKYQYRLQQVDLDGTATLSETILMDVAAPVPTTFVLNQNYPNPFNPSTQISFSTTKEGPVTLRVFDILGREVSTLVNENRKAGEYSERFDGSRVASGVYMYVLRSSEGQLTSRMVLSK